MLGPLRLRALAPDEIDVALSIDDDACTLFADAGIVLDLPADHPFAAAERRRWMDAAAHGLAQVAVDVDGTNLALLVLARLDGLALGSSR